MRGFHHLSRPELNGHSRGLFDPTSTLGGHRVLLHLGQIVDVTIPTVAQDAARDLVRAREDCRGDVMTSRHRISKLLLRQGIVYYGGQAWNGKHEMWLRAQRFDSSALMLAYESALDAMVAGVHRRIVSMRPSPRWPPIPSSPRS